MREILILWMRVNSDTRRIENKMWPFFGWDITDEECPAFLRKRL